MSHIPKKPELIKDLLVLDKDYKFLKRIDDHFSTWQNLHVHSIPVISPQILFNELDASPFSIILIGPNISLNNAYSVSFTKMKKLNTIIIKVVTNESPEVLIECICKGIENYITIENLLQNFDLALKNIIQKGSFIDPILVQAIIPQLTKINQASKM